jgi:hypothetical protein
MEFHFRAFVSKLCLNLPNRNTVLVVMSRSSFLPAVKAKVFPIHPRAFGDVLTPAQEVVLNDIKAVRKIKS